MGSVNANILVVDDEIVVRRVLSDALAQAGHRVRSAGSGADALALLAEEPADLVLLDLQLGDSDGVEVMQIIRERRPQTQIIILTAHGSMASAIAALRSEAADYLLKPIGVEVLRQRVAEVLMRYQANRERLDRLRAMYAQMQALVADEGGLQVEEPPSPLAERAINAGLLSIDVGRHEVRMGSQPIEVTPTEFAILQTLARTPGTVVPCMQIVQAFQGAVTDEDEARQMLRPHIVRLRRKLEPNPSRPIFLQSVRGIGYRWSSDGVDESDEG
ncbi:MAG: response regulator transcription factor [Oscillochloridaceae bacterium umkhey_bin13]